MKYSLAYSFNEGIIGGILRTLSPHISTKDEIVYHIIKDVLFKEWSKNLKEINISIKVNRGK